MIRFLCCLFLLALLSCSSTDERKAGICLSFDDRSISEWHQCRPLFKKHNARCTFFITQFDSLSPKEIDMLHDLKKDGHEIASHGARHEIAEYYIKTNGYGDYLADEVDHSIQSMNQSGFEISSFSYPYGSTYWLTDLLLLKKFEHLRHVSILNDQPIDQHDDIYYNYDGRRVLTALAIDNNTSLTLDEVESAYARAQSRKEVVLFFAHCPVLKSKAHEHTIHIKRLENVLKLANQYGLQFYRFDELR